MTKQELIERIIETIYENVTQDITGDALQGVLRDMVGSLVTSDELNEEIENEKDAREGADALLQGLVDAINSKIPSAASASNQLADKAFVNSSIATGTATFRGTSAKNLTEAQFLAWANTLPHDLNDYIFWDTSDTLGNQQFKRYKYTGSQWQYEYTLNNSTFTAAQWEAINSGLTSGDKDALDEALEIIDGLCAPTYTIATTLADLVSGEDYKVAFGKIAKAVNILISHLNDNVRHITSSERTAWNNKKDKQTPKTNPETDGEEIAFIDTITQDAQGVITATRKEVREASSEQSGVVSTGAQSFSGNKTFDDALIGKKGVAAGGAASDSAIGGSGVTDHRLLEHRDANNQHPISAITDLEGTLDELSGGLETEAQTRAQADQTVLSSAANDASSKVNSHNASNTAHSSLFNSKVDKVEGKGLSTEDYTTAEKNNVSANTNARHTHSNKNILDNTTASYTTDEKTKLSELENYDDTEIKNAILELQVADANLHIDVIQEINERKNADAELAFKTSIINDNLGVASPSGVAAGGAASDDAIGSAGVTDHRQLTNRDAAEQHPIGAITDLQDTLDSKVDKDGDKGLSSNDYTTAEKNKLDSLHNYDDTELRVEDANIHIDIIRESNERKTNDAELKEGVIENAQAIQAEENARVIADQALSGAINAEKTRAEGVEEVLATALQNKKDKQTAVDVSGSNVKTITRLQQNAQGVVTPTFTDIPSASANQKGLMDTTTQTFGGNKTFNGSVISQQGIAAGGSASDSAIGSAGTTDHRQLTHRNEPNQHSISSITDLQDTLDALGETDEGLQDALDIINGKIPSEATSTNKLADKAFVNSSISTNTATFRGTSASGLSEAQFLAWANGLTHDLNDYVFWNTTDSAGNVQFKRYKYNGSAWVFEYTLNNSSFTASQWATIQSGLTSSDKTNYNNHLSNTSNPHGVTKVQVGLGNVDNTSDINKPVSNAMQNAIDAEETARINADNTLSGAIDAEETRAQGAETTLQSNINTERSERVTADAALNGAINSEIENRKNADLELQIADANQNIDIQREVYERKISDTEFAFKTSIINDDLSVTSPSGIAAGGATSDTAIGTSGTTDHRQLTNRDAAEQHPISAITGLTSALGGKQDVISDLNTIRSGASAGATAYQKPTGGIPKSDLASAVQSSLGKADSALQQHQSLDGYVNGITTDSTTSFADSSTIVVGKSGKNILTRTASALFTYIKSKLPSWSTADTKPTYSKSEIGLGNVDNTSDINKPVSNAMQTALNGKVDKTTTINGHALSSNVTITKGDVGLGNVDNTSDLNKPVSTATQNALTQRDIEDANIRIDLLREENERKTNDAELKADILNEVSRAQGAESTLTTAISNEATARSNEDTSIRNAMQTKSAMITSWLGTPDHNHYPSAKLTRDSIDVVQSNLTTEINNRKDADLALQIEDANQNIDIQREIHERKTADTDFAFRTSIVKDDLSVVTPSGVASGGITSDAGLRPYKFITQISATGDITQNIVHNLGSADVVVTIHKNSNGYWQPDSSMYRIVDNNTINVYPYSTGIYRITIIV